MNKWEKKKIVTFYLGIKQGETPPKMVTLFCLTASSSSSFLGKRHIVSVFLFLKNFMQNNVFLKYIINW